MTDVAIWLETDPRRHAGSPVIRGSRIPAAAVTAMLDRGYDVDRVLAAFPDLPRGAIEFLAGPSAATRRHAQQLERTIVALRTASPPARFQAIADALGMTRGRVHQIWSASPEGRALGRQQRARARAWGRPA